MEHPRIDTSRFEEMIRVMESVAQHKRARSAEETDALFYELMADYNRRVLEAKEEGKWVVAHTVMVPNEIFYALDIVPFQLDNAVNTLVTSIKNQEEVFAVAKEFGFVPELCSAHRAQAALGLRGWLPQVDAVIWSHQVCDNSAKSGGLVAESYGVPSFFLDRPYGFSEKEVGYYAGELGEMVHFLEALSGRRMDWDRF
ncbi:MAG: 2-hydroxyacyl-CoA dehydratase, partial [Dehalococcoidia bacterium]